MEPKRVKAVWRASAKTYVLRWTDRSGRARQKSTGLSDRRDRAAADIMAAELADRLTRAEFAGGMFADVEPEDVTSWNVFCDIFEREHMAHLSLKSQQNWAAARKAVEEILAPSRIEDLTSPAMLVLMTRLKGSPATRKTRLAWVRRLLTWALELDLIDRCPRIPTPKGASSGKVRRSVTLEEFERILEAANQVIPRRAREYQRLMLGLWHSGFRIGELLKLSWEPGAGVVIERAGHFPTITFRGDSQKNGRDQVIPVTTEFWDLANEVRHGFVFPIPSNTGLQISEGRAIHIVSRCGAAANVVVNPATKETASSTDIGRRAFATRMSRLLSPQQLAAIMRHASIETTNRHYVRESLELMASKIWEPSPGDKSGDI